MLKEGRNLNAERVAVSQGTIDMLYKCRTICSKCNCKINFSIIGTSIAKTFIGLCNNRHCNNSKVTSNDTIGVFDKINLAVVLQILRMDVGWSGIFHG